jgi:hypothetical protein
MALKRDKNVIDIKDLFSTKMQAIFIEGRYI